MKLILCFLLATISAPSMAQQIEESPLVLRMKDTPLNENPVGGYATFGTFTDGLPAIEVAAQDVAQFFEREKFHPMTPYIKVQINCKLGQMKIVGMGDATEIRNMPEINEAKIINLRDTHPENKPVYEKICKQAGFKLSYKNN